MMTSERLSPQVQQGKDCHPKCDVATAIEAFRQGLVRSSELYKELTKYPCSTFEDVQAKTLAQIRFEEDSKPRSDSPDYERTNRKAHNSKSGNNKNAPYHRSEKVQCKCSP